MLTCYDLGLKTAFVARWPSRVASGSTTDAMTQYVDVVPTLIEAAGGTIPDDIDGRSFLPVLTGSATEHRDYVYGVQTTRGIINGPDYPIRSIRSKRYKLILNLNAKAERFDNVLSADWFVASPVLPSWERLGGIAAERARFYWDRPEVELYDVIADPWELNNIADKPSSRAIVADLKPRLLAWMKEQGDEGLATERKATERQRQGHLEGMIQRLKERSRD